MWIHAVWNVKIECITFYLQCNIIEYHCVYWCFCFRFDFTFMNSKEKISAENGQNWSGYNFFFGLLWSGFLYYFIRLDKTGNTYIDTKTWSVFLFCKYFRYFSLFSPISFENTTKIKNALHITKKDIIWMKNKKNESWTNKIK